MALSKLGFVLSATLVASSLVSVGINQPAMAKSKRHSSYAGRGAYFVPPPPPYAPSILPERAVYAQSAQVGDVADADAAVVKPPENPYKRYIYTPNQDDMPRVIQPNKYVSYVHKT